MKMQSNINLAAVAVFFLGFAICSDVGSAEHCRSLESKVRDYINSEMEQSVDLTVVEDRNSNIFSASHGGGNSVVKGKKKIKIVGDVVRVNDQTFSSLIRSMPDALTNVSEIVIDAKKVIISGPLNITSGLIKIKTLSLSFQEHGALGITAGGQNNSGVYIEAEKVIVEKDAGILLNFLEDSSGTSFSLKTARVIDSSGVEVPFGSMSKFFYMRSSLYDGRSNMPPKNWDFGEFQYGGLVEWPDFLVDKYKKMHFMRPYTLLTESDVYESIREVRPSFVKFASPSSILNLDSLQNSIKGRLGPDGSNEYHIPNVDFVTALKIFNDRRSVLKERLSFYANQLDIVRVSRKPNSEYVRKIRDDYQHAIRQIDGSLKKLDSYNASLADSENKSRTLLTGIDEQRSVSKLRYERLLRSAENAEEMRQFTTAASVAVSFIGTPATGAALSTAVSVGGGVVLQRAQGKGTKIDLMELGNFVAEQHKYYDSVIQQRESWAAVSDNIKDGVKVLSQSKDTISNRNNSLSRSKIVGEFGKSLTLVADQARMFDAKGPGGRVGGELSLNGVESENADLQDLIRQLSAQKSIQAELIEAIKQESAELSKRTLYASGLSQGIEELLRLDGVGNDIQTLAWRKALARMWVDVIREMALQGRELRGAFLYQTGRGFVGADEILNFPDTVGLEWTVEKIALGLQNDDDFSKKLIKNVDEIFGKFDAFSALAETSWQRYKRGLSAGGRVELLTFSVGSDVLKYMNESIKSGEVSPYYELPVEFGRPVRSGSPERLTEVYVSKVEFDSGEKATLKFSIKYRPAGEIWRDGQCFIADLTPVEPVDGDGFVVRQFRTPLSSVSRQVRSATVNDVENYIALPPARSNYYLSVENLGDRDIPVLKSVDVSFEYYR